MKGGIIGAVIAWVTLFAARLGLEYLANEYEFFGKWLTISTVALIAVSVVLLAAFVTYLAQQWSTIKELFGKGESAPPTSRPAAGKEGKESGRSWSERRAAKRAERAERKDRRKAERDKVWRVESFEKRWRR